MYLQCRRFASPRGCWTAVVSATLSLTGRNSIFEYLKFIMWVMCWVRMMLNQTLRKLKQSSLCQPQSIVKTYRDSWVWWPICLSSSQTCLRRGSTPPATPERCWMVLGTNRRWHIYLPEEFNLFSSSPSSSLTRKNQGTCLLMQAQKVLVQFFCRMTTQSLTHPKPWLQAKKIMRR